MLAYLVSTSPWLLDVDEHDGDGGAGLITEDLSTIVPILQNFGKQNQNKKQISILHCHPLFAYIISISIKSGDRLKGRH